MRSCTHLPRWVARALVAPCALVLAGTAADARPGVVGAAGVHVAPGHGARWVGGPYRPWIRPAWPAWGYAYPGYRYPGYYGFGWGLGLGYGAGWAVATSPAWGWGVPPSAYLMPSWVPMGVAVPPTSAVEEVVAESAPAPAPQALPQQPGYWYYCTEPAGYYPYVNTCSRPWIAVQPAAR